MGKAKIEGPKGKLAGRYKQRERVVPCVRDQQHPSIPLDYRPEVGRPINARGCETCKIAWRFTCFRNYGPYVLLAEDVPFPTGRG